MYRQTLFLTVIWICHLLSGCVKVGPDYLKPAVDLPVSWQAPIERGLHAKPSDPQRMAEWWKLLNDPLLSNFIEQAITGNLDLEQARSRLIEARAQGDISSAILFPGLDFNGSMTRSRSGSNESTLYSLGFDAGWELDLFGGGQRSVEAAQAQIEASREDLRDILVTLTAEVALNYIDFRSYQARLRIAHANLIAQQESFSLAEARYQSGLTSELAVQQAKYLESSTRAQIPALQSEMTHSANRLTVLLGCPPGLLDSQLQPATALPNLPRSIAVGIPADTLRHRPDIRRAERQLAAQTALVGVATADLYPSFRLGGSIGLDALSAGKLFRSDSRSSSFGPSVTLPLFDAGAIRANILVQTSRQQQALAEYQSTILTALEEVENGLTAYAREQERNQALQESVEAAGQATTLAEIQYQAGMVNFIEVLVARRSLLSFEDQLADSSGTMATNLIRLYKALGGGWTSFVPEPATITGEQP